MLFSLPLKKMKNVDKTLLFKEIRKMTLLGTTIFYIVDSDFRKSVDVRRWYEDWSAHTDLVLPTFEGSDREKCVLALSWVRDNITYVGDLSRWEMVERWQLPNITATLGTGDCEDGALLLYEILRRSGVSDDQLFIVAGDVVGGGHCYVVWRSDDDLLEYVLDWCYWPEDSLRTPYELNPNYFFGREEWFRFNIGGSYVKKL